MDLQTLLGDMKKADFVSEYFHRLPFSLPQTARPLCDLVGWDALDEILGRDSADVMVVRDGIRSGDRSPRTAADARTLLDQGHTILVRHAERHDARLGELASAFARDFEAPVDVHVYITPPGRHGFSWHYDAEDVFIVQAAGHKEYSLRKNTVNPWPLVETIPEDMQYPREIMPLVRALLVPGDWLYIPCGYWHKADAPGGAEPSISLAVGVLSPAAIDLLDHLRDLLRDSLLWRARLPVSGEAAPLAPDELVAHYQELGRQLADDVGRMLADERFLRDFLARRRDGRGGSPGRRQFKPLGQP